LFEYIIPLVLDRVVKRLAHELDVDTYNCAVETMRHGVNNNTQEEIPNQYMLPIEQIKNWVRFQNLQRLKSHIILHKSCKMKLNCIAEEAYIKTDNKRRVF